MYLDKICLKIAARELGKPGTLVECILPCRSQIGDLIVGKQYIVKGIHATGTDITIEGFSSWFADRFKKVIE